MTSARRWPARRLIRDEVIRLDNARLGSRLRRPEVSYASLKNEDVNRPVLSEEVCTEVEIEVKYSGYVRMAETARARRSETHDGWKIPEGFVFRKVRGLGDAAIERLERDRPDTVGHARRIPGLTPAAMSLLLIALRKSSEGG